jgi:hypothetical protein
MNKQNDYILIEKESWQSILQLVNDLTTEVATLINKINPAPDVYTNKEVRELLHVNDKLIRKYRDDGLLEYSCKDGKYWYNKKNVENFLKKCRNK